MCHIRSGKIISLALMLCAWFGMAATAAQQATLYGNGHTDLYELNTQRPLNLSVRTVGDTGNNAIESYTLMALFEERLLFMNETGGWQGSMSTTFTVPASENREPFSLGSFTLGVGTYELYLLRMDGINATIASKLTVVVSKAKTTVRIGMLTGNTGSMEPFADEFTTAASITREAAEQYLGQPVEIIARDTASDPTQALTALQELEQEGLRIVVAPISSAELAAIREYADTHGILLLNPVSTATDLAFDDTTYRTIFGNDVLMTATAEYMTKREIGTVIPLYRNDTYGKNMLTELQGALANSIITVGTPVSFAPQTTDFTSTLAALREAVTAATAPVAIHLTAYPDDAAAIFRAASKDTTLKGVNWIGCDALALSTKFIEPEEVTANTTDSTTGASTLANVEINTDVMDFAAAVHFVAPIPTPELAYAKLPISPTTIVFQYQVKREMQTSKTPTSWIYPVCDAIWAACIAESACTAATAPTVADCRSLLEQTLQNTTGNTGALGTNELGERTNGQIGFYQVRGEDKRWIPVAAYAKPIITSIIPTYSELEPLPILSDDVESSRVKIGLMLPISGSAAEIGMDAYMVALRAYQMIYRAQLAIMPTGQIRVYAHDTESTPAKALVGIQKLHEEGVRIVLGPLTSACLAAVAPYANEHDMVIISPTSTALSLANNDNVYRLSLNDGYQATALALYAKKMGLTTIIPVIRNDTYGASMKNAMQQACTQQGLTLTQSVSYDPTNLIYNESTGTLTNGSTVFAPVIASTESILTDLLKNQTSDTVGILMISLDEGVQLLESASASSTLDSVRWLSGDGFAGNYSLLQNSTAMLFARNTKLTACVQTAADTYATAGRNLVMHYTQRRILSDQCGFELTGRELNYYDAFSLVSFALMSQNFNIPDTNAIKAGIEIAGKAVHSSIAMVFDENGDRTKGNIGLLEVTQAENGTTWKEVAICPFLFGLEPSIKLITE